MGEPGRLFHSSGSMTRILALEAVPNSDTLMVSGFGPEHDCIQPMSKSALHTHEMKEKHTERNHIE